MAVLYIHVHKIGKGRFFFNLNSFILHADVSVCVQICTDARIQALL